jgi:regulatory protein
VAFDQNVLRPDVPAWRDTAEDEDYRSAMERAGRLLTVRARSEREMRTRLGQAGYAPDVVEAVVIRLSDLSLIDDLAFAGEWIAEQVSRKPVSPDVLLRKLVDKGVERELAQAALAEAGIDEVAAATQVAAGLVRRVLDRPLAEQGPRLVQMVVRRGFSFEAAEEGARAVLPPEGWD